MCIFLLKQPLDMLAHCADDESTLQRMEAWQASSWGNMLKALCQNFYEWM